MNVHLIQNGEKEAVQRHVGKAVLAVGVFEQFQSNAAELFVANDEADEECHKGVEAAVFRVTVFKRPLVEVEVVVAVAMLVELLQNFARKSEPIDGFERQGVETRSEAFVALFLWLGVDEHVGVMRGFEEVEDEKYQVFQLDVADRI